MLATIFKSMDNENIEGTFHLCFDDNLMNKIVQHTNHRISKSIFQLRRNDNVCESDKCCWVKFIDNIEFDTLFKLMLFRCFLGVNSYLTDRLFSGDSPFLFLVLPSQRLVADSWEPNLV